MGRDDKIGDERVRASTGRGWDEWFTLIDDFGGEEKGHQAIAKYLHEEHRVSPWYSQAITVQYERERGMHDVLERPEGFCATATRRIGGVGVETAYGAWTSSESLQEWLHREAAVDARVGGRFSAFSGHTGWIAALRPRARIRIAWDEAAPRGEVEVSFRHEEDGCVVQLQHSKLASKAVADEYKAYWKRAMDSMRSFLTG